MDPAMW